MLSLFDDHYSSLEDIETGFRRCDYIKYAAYRTAAKLRIVQKALHMDKVPLKVIACVFERHQLQQTENSVQLDRKEVNSVLSDIYFAVEKENNILFNIDLVSELMFNFLLNVFDKKVSNLLQVLSFKIGLTLLCQAKPREKYHYLFEQLANHNNCLSRKKLEILLKRMMRLTEHLGEGLSFGSELIPGTVESCFKCNLGTLGITEDVFMSWLMQDPQLLVWLSTLYRIQISESVSHNVKCGICKTYPLLGLRYRCLRCLSYDMCQSCFFTGKYNKKHKLKHPVQEYCCPMTSQQSTKAFLLTLRNILCKKDYKLQYLPALKVDSRNEKALSQSTRLLDEMEVSSKTVVNGSRISLNRFSYPELQSVLLHLEKESEKIISQIEGFCTELENSEGAENKTHLKNCLMQQKTQVRTYNFAEELPILVNYKLSMGLQVKTQIDRLKLLRRYLSSNGKFDAKAFLASTPMGEEVFPKSKKDNFSVDFADFSPISIRTSKQRKEKGCQKKMMWDNYDLGVGGSKPSWEEIESSSLEKRSLEILEKSEENNGSRWTKGTTRKSNESEIEFSCWLGGKTIRDSNESFKRGYTWLFKNEMGTSEENSVRDDIEETFEELQSDLKIILNKLQELSVSISKEEIKEEESENEREISKMNEAPPDVDGLLADLINGIGHLMEN